MQMLIEFYPFRKKKVIPTRSLSNVSLPSPQMKQTLSWSSFFSSSSDLSAPNVSMITALI